MACFPHVPSEMKDNENICLIAKSCTEIVHKQETLHDLKQALVNDLLIGLNVAPGMGTIRLVSCGCWPAGIPIW